MSVDEKWLATHNQDERAKIKSAVVTLVQVLSKLRKNRCVDGALYDIDLSDEAYEEDLQTVKDAVGWED